MLLRELVASAPVLSDGAWGTELQRLDLPPGDCPDSWNLLEPELVREVARSWVDAGSRVILTNTFRANAISLAPWRLDSAVSEINLAGARLSREAAGTRAKVFGSIGPTGEHLALNHLRREAAYAAFSEQAAELAAGGVDALLLETFGDVEEARIALRAVRNTGLPAIVSFAFVSGRAQDRSATSLTPEEAAREMTEAGADAVGANCCTIEASVAICRRLRSATHLPLWMKPNTGPGDPAHNQPASDRTTEHFADYVPALIDAGATFIGGCCGATPGLIRVLADTLAARTEVRHAHQGY
jgi:methionine synthase I (cobalamin-dependent)